MKRRRWRVIVCAIVAVPAAAFLLTAALIVLDGLSDEPGPVDVAVVLGNKVHRDGRPSARLQARLEKALEVYRKGLAGTILVSGGLGREGHDEAVVMQRYLVERGVPEGCIHVDSNGTNTFRTARNTARFLEAEGLSSVMAVSQYFHVPRARLALQRCGIPTVKGAHADYFEWRDIYATAREVVAYCAYWLRAPPE